jgi:hypothetical protein
MKEKHLGKKFAWYQFFKSFFNRKQKMTPAGLVQQAYLKCKNYKVIKQE